MDEQRMRERRGEGVVEWWTRKPRAEGRTCPPCGAGEGRGRDAGGRGGGRCAKQRGKKNKTAGWHEAGEVWRRGSVCGVPQPCVLSSPPSRAGGRGDGHGGGGVWEGADGGTAGVTVAAAEETVAATEIAAVDGIAADVAAAAENAAVLVLVEEARGVVCWALGGAVLGASSSPVWGCAVPVSAVGPPGGCGAARAHSPPGTCTHARGPPHCPSSPVW